MKNLTQTLKCVAIIAAVTGLFFHILFNMLLNGAILETVKNSNGNSANLLVGLLVVAAFLYVFMILAIIISGLIAWLVMRHLHVPKAGEVILLASLVLSIVWYVFIQVGLPEAAPKLVLSVVSFIVVYVSCILILSKRMHFVDAK